MATHKDFMEALREYANYHADIGTLYIGIPHQLPPKVIDADINPPDEEDGDRYVKGDHDFHGCISLADGLAYEGHQAIAVRRAARKEVHSWLRDGWWQERVLCKVFDGERFDCPAFTAISDTLDWDCIYPVVDGEFCLTGEIVEDTGGYVMVDRVRAAMPEADAKDAGHPVKDGCVSSTTEVE